ncbi:hypothetical protein GEMRC1_009283 [Eukaryota sp. GEM-RC1]
MGDHNSVDSETECSVCYESMTHGECSTPITSKCKHSRKVCNSCIARWIDENVMVYNAMRPIECLHANCDEILHSNDVQRFASTYEIYQNFETGLTIQCLQVDPDFRWCPHADCGNGFFIHPSSDPRVRCDTCHHDMCSEDKVPWHSGQTCAQWRDNDDESLALIGKISSPCPLCKHPFFVEFPVFFTLPSHVRQASLGNEHSLVLLANGDVYSTGRNNYGQLGYVGGDRRVHEKIQIFNIIQVLASYWSSYALSASGYVYSWGRNWDGTLGLGDTIDRDTPILIPNLKNVKQISGRYYTTFALTRDGKVYGWGSGGYNILCRSSTTNLHSPMVINSLQNIKFIAAGQAAFLIKDDGFTLTCGRRLGGSGTSSSPAPFANHIEFTFIDTTNIHALGIDVNQKLWSWGDGGNGRLGRGSTSTTPVEVKNIGKVITAAAGMYHSTAVDVNNDVWSWGTHGSGALGRVTDSDDERRNPDRITHLEDKGVTGISAWAGSNFAYISVPPPTIDLITSSNEDMLIMEGNNSITGNFNGNGLHHVNIIFLPVFLSGSLDLTSDSFFFLSEFILNDPLSINSPTETYFNSLFLGASECSTLFLESTVFVETLYWYCGTIEGVGELKVNTLVFCSSNPELKLSRISIGIMMTSELNVNLNLTSDLVLSVNGVIEIPQLSFYSDSDVCLTFNGSFTMINTSLSLRVESNFKSIIEIDQNSKIQIISSSSTLGTDLPLFLHYDWSESSSGNDLSGNNNNVLEVSGAEWNSDGYYQFESDTDTFNIPNIPSRFGWQSATISLLIWFDSNSGNRFGLSSCGCGISLGDSLYYGCSGSSVNIPRNQWINLVMTTSNNQARFYINGELVETINSQYNCETPSDFIPLGNRYFYSSSNEQWERSTHSSNVFKGRIKKLFVLTRGLTESEITSEFTLAHSITGLGSIELKNSDLTLLDNSSISFSKLILESSILYLYSFTYLNKQGVHAFNESEIIFNGDSDTVYFAHSHIQLDNSTIIHSAVELNLYNLTLSNTAFQIPPGTKKLSIHALYLELNSDVHISSAFRVNSIGYTGR